MARRQSMTTVHSWDEVPAFSSEDEEHRFWATHEIGDELWDTSEELPAGFLPPPRPRAIAVTLHLDAETVQRAKDLATTQHKGYKDVLREIIQQQLASQGESA